MATSLSGKSIGAPDNAFAWYLQSGGGTLAAGFPVALGNGTETPLWIDENGIGEVAPTGFIRRITEKVLATDVSNSTVTAAAVSALEIALVASAVYDFEALLLCKSAATTTGVQVRVTGPSAQTDFVCYDMTQVITNTLLTTNTRRQYFTAFDQNMANLDAPAATSLFPVFVRGVIKTTASAPATPLGISFQSEVAASAVTIAAGSILRIKRIG
jgi:hypothetical protein